ncbi:MFS general substrate transporter [Violaceomyces palustris]|uniref:MFS general substrate transporter n=1 Tax=Violaceomyces palustris TaxID=1673888 RepID=A0ACD0P061_9BASI|nr:MFS general substrate transporter [Violaceomyces palustris]
MASPDDRKVVQPASTSSHGPSESPPSDVEAPQQRGVTRIEALYKVLGKGALGVWVFYVAIAAICYLTGLEGSTTGRYTPIVTSAFNDHSALATIATAEGIMTAVCKPFIAKVADITSRQHAYLVVTTLYVLGFVIIASARNITAVCIGRVLSTLGSAGLDLITDIIVADLTPLQWRGVMTALTSAPYIINAYVGSEIATHFIDMKNGWRWGYGMFCIMIPSVMTPALCVLFWADRKAQRQGLLSFSASPYDTRSFFQLVREFAIQIDLFGLLLLGFAWSLIFLPFTLAKNAKGGYDNPSMIAMLCVGFVLLIGFGIWEKFFARVPMMPKRILTNRTFQMAVTIDIFYFMSGTLRSTYYSSYVYIVTNWNTRQWNYFLTTETVGLCVFGICAGLLQRATHRYKWIQLTGICIRMLGMGITIYARGPNATTVALVWTQILISMGGACSVVGTRVASQGSVPHQDLATVIALLSLWTKLGGAMGSAIAGAVWTGNMLPNMERELPQVSQTILKSLYASITTVKTKYAFGSEVRNGVIRAYDKTVLPLFVSSLCISKSFRSPTLPFPVRMAR